MNWDSPKGELGEIARDVTCQEKPRSADRTLAGMLPEASSSTNGLPVHQTTSDRPSIGVQPTARLRADEVA